MTEKSIAELQSRIDSLTRREKFFLKKMLKEKVRRRYFDEWLKFQLVATKKPFIIQNYL